MKKNGNCNVITLGILIIVLLLSFLFINKNLKKNGNLSEEIKLQENTTKNDGFALMLEQSDGTYEESTSSSWPTNMYFNSELSGCVDADGDKIENTLVYDKNTNEVTILTTKACYCYVYFDIDRDAPIVTATINNNNTKEVTLTIISNEDGEYCVNESSTINNRLNCVFSGNIKENESIETNVFKKSGNYYVHIKDSAGNVGISEMLSINISTSISNYLIENVSSDVLWKSTLEDDGYRFVGTNPDNYICFGTTDKDTCVKHTNKYRYRIIGIFEDEVGNKHTKLIKEEALSKQQEYAWDSNCYTGVDWNESVLYKKINGSYFLTNTNYSYMQDTSWTDKIATWNYTMTNTKSYENYTTNSVYGPTYRYETGKTIYLHELNRSGKSNESCHYNSTTSADCNVGEWKTINAKISLMYVSDYALSLGETALNYTSYDNSDTLQTGWMHLSNSNINSYPLLADEWTMSRFGKSTKNYYSSYMVNNNGSGSTYACCESVGAMRPVFYLASDVEILGGTGTISDPYIISY